MHDYLKLAIEGKLISRTHPRELETLREDQKETSQQLRRAISGASLFFSGVVLIGLDVGPAYLVEASAPGIVCMAIGAWLLLRASTRS